MQFRSLQPRSSMDNKQDILVLVKTYPEISTQYTETVCTAGILKSTRALVRLYPIRFRYLEGESQFRKYQWIRARLSVPERDSRPESRRLAGDSIELGDVIGTGDGWLEREKWVVNENTLHDSVEALWESQESNNTSLGVVRPRQILEAYVDHKTADEIQEAEEKKASVLSQMGLFETPKDIELLPFRLMLRFRCDRPACREHKMSILDWEFGQLYRKVKRDPDWEEKLTRKVMTLCGPERDPYLILGNMARWPNVFYVLSIFHPPRERQQVLF